MKKRVLILGVGLALSAAQVMAAPFSYFDPRSMGMGGAGVATGTSANASFFNPALLAAAQKDEDFSLEFPIIGMRVADPDELTTNLSDFQDANYIDNLSSALDAWNAGTPTLAEANAVVNAGQGLVDGLVSLSDRALEGQLNAGLVVGIPSKRVGAAVHVNATAMGGALLNITTGDQAEVQSIINTLNTAIAAYEGGDATALASVGGLTDPTGTFTSRVVGRGAVVSEVGISLARDFQGIAVGVTPKYLNVETFDYALDIDTADVTFDEGRKSGSGFNLDLGVAKDFGNGWKTGLVVRNAVTQSYATALGNKFEIKPQGRAGVGYRRGWATLAADLDLTENDPAGLDKKTQYMALGAELDAWKTLQVRLGYRHNLKDSDASVASLGIGASPFGVHMDLAVAGNDKEVALALQTGFRF